VNESRSSSVTERRWWTGEKVYQSTSR